MVKDKLNVHVAVPGPEVFLVIRIDIDLVQVPPQHSRVAHMTKTQCIDVLPVFNVKEFTHHPDTSLQPCQMQLQCCLLLFVMSLHDLFDLFLIITKALHFGQDLCIEP